MDRKRRGPDGAEMREPREAAGSPRRPPSVVDAILELQTAVGNRGVAAAIERATVQRQPAGAGKNDGGALTLDSGEAIPLQSATWYLKLGTKAMQRGKQGPSELVPGKREIGALVLTRRQDAHSARTSELIDTTHEEGSLRLDRPSRDGTLPATSLAVRDVEFLAYSRGRGDLPTETLTMAVGDIKVAGLGTEVSEARAAAHLRIAAGAEAWTPVPVFSWDGGEARERLGPESGARGPILRGQAAPELLHISVKIAAGAAVTRLAEALDQNLRLELGLLPKGARSELVLRDALVEKVSSSADGPEVVEVGFVGER